MSKITAIAQQKKLRNRFNLFIDGKFDIGIDGSLILKYDLKIGDEFTPALKRNLENDDRLELAYSGLLNYIAYRERCEHEVQVWLKKKGYSGFEADLITRLKQKNYLNDARYTRLFIRDHVRLKGWGPIRLRHELASKRIAKAIIEDELEIIRDEFNFSQMALDQLHYKLKYTQHPNYKDKKRLWNMLRRRGFENQSITFAMDQINFAADNPETDT